MRKSTIVHSEIIFLKEEIYLPTWIKVLNYCLNDLCSQWDSWFWTNTSCFTFTSTGEQFLKKQPTNKQLEIIFTQILWSVQWPCQQLQRYIQTHADWFFILVRPLLKHWTDYEFFFYSWLWQWAHDRCNWSKGDSYS